MRRFVLNLMGWTVLLGGSTATVHWAGREPEPSSILTVNGKPLPLTPGNGPRHNPATCRSCNLGTQARWDRR
jgi:hypothetical protein